MVQINSVTLIQQKWNILNPFPFKDGVNIIEYSNTNEYLEKIIYYLNNKRKLIEIGNKGYLHSLKHHTGDERLNYIFDVINNKVNLHEIFKIKKSKT